MSLNQLPPVAKSFFAFCKKCDADRYHTVLAHTTSKTAKIKCEVCGSQKSYSLPKAVGAGKAKVSRPRASTESARKSSHAAEYEALINTHQGKSSTAYNIRGKFQLNEKIDHPKFGTGIVRQVQPEKVEVVFADEVRQLVHNRQ